MVDLAQFTCSMYELQDVVWEDLWRVCHRKYGARLVQMPAGTQTQRQKHILRRLSSLPRRSLLSREPKWSGDVSAHLSGSLLKSCANVLAKGGSGVYADDDVLSPHVNIVSAEEIVDASREKSADPGNLDREEKTESKDFESATVRDMLLYSPVLLNENQVTRLFLLYQLLQAMAHAQSEGRYFTCSLCGADLPERGNNRCHIEITWASVLIDDHLWLRVPDWCFAGLPTTTTEERTELCTGDGLESQIDKDSEESRPVDGKVLADVTYEWLVGRLSTFDYLIYLNALAGRSRSNPRNYPILPWVTDFSRTWPSKQSLRDLTKSKFRLTRGDAQLQQTYGPLDAQADLVRSSHAEGASQGARPISSGRESIGLLPRSTSMSSSGYATSREHANKPSSGHVAPHHVTEYLSEITYYVYQARRTPRHTLCRHVRARWVPEEYPQSMRRLYQWTPDECIPDFYTDPGIFRSVHEDLADLEVPSWCNDAEDFIEKHRKLLESDAVSEELHSWIDLTFGYLLSGEKAVQEMNVCLQLVDNHRQLMKHGVTQLFTVPHPRRLVSTKYFSAIPPCLPSAYSQRSDSKLSSKEAWTLWSDEPSPKKSGDKGSFQEAEAKIELPDDYEPLALLDQLRSLSAFSHATSGRLPAQVFAEPPKEVAAKSPEYYSRLDTLRFGCMMMELFMPMKFACISTGCAGASTLAERVGLCNRLCRKGAAELPSVIAEAACQIFTVPSTDEPNSARLHQKDSAQLLEALLQEGSVSAQGYPPLCARHFLNSVTSPLKFPAYFSPLHSLCCELKAIDVKLSRTVATEASDECFYPEGEEKTKADLMVAKEEKRHLVAAKIDAVSVGLPDLMTQGLDEWGVELLLPYLVDLFVHPETSPSASWALFAPVATLLGPNRTQEHVLPSLLTLYNAEEPSTPRHMKFYHHLFLRCVVTRLGLVNFLKYFVRLLVEAVGGNRDFLEGNDSSLTHRRVVSQSPGTEGFLETRDQSAPSSSEAENFLNRAAASDGDRHVETGPDMAPIATTTITSGDLDFELAPVGRKRSLDMFGEVMDSVENITLDIGPSTSSDQSSTSDGQSFSTHSEVSQDEPEGRTLELGVCQRQVSGISGTSGLDLRGSGSSGELVTAPAEKPNTATKGYGKRGDVQTGDARKQPAPSDERVLPLNCNIRDVAGESVLHLARRLGPTLTARWLSGNLLSMLGLCYVTEDQLLSCDTTSGLQLTVCGDQSAAKVIECLLEIAILYGERFVLGQYIPHVTKFAGLGKTKRLNPYLEGNMIGCVVLLHQVLPYLSDATLMDTLKEIVFESVLGPLLDIVRSPEVRFQGGALARSTLAYKLLHLMYQIAMRLDFQLTREHMPSVLRRFFSAFDQVFDEPTSPVEQSRMANSTHASTGDRFTIGAANDPLKNVSANDDPGDTRAARRCSYVRVQLDAEAHEYRVATAAESLLQSTNQDTALPSAASATSASVETSDMSASQAATKAEILCQLRAVFTPQLAHYSYVAFCRLAGGIYMDETLDNCALIRRLCAVYDQTDAARSRSPDFDTGQISSPTGAGAFSSAERMTSGAGSSFGAGFGSPPGFEPKRGNRLVSAISPGKQSIRQSDTAQIPASQLVNDPLHIDFVMLRRSELQDNPHRHLKDNWFLHWEYELGHNREGAGLLLQQMRLQNYEGHTGPIRDLELLLDYENSFLSAGKDRTVKLWSIRNQGDSSTRLPCRWTYSNHKRPVTYVMFMASIRRVASCDGSVHIWDPFIGRAVRQYTSSKEGFVTAIHKLPLPTWSLLASTSDATLRFLDTRSHSPAIREFSVPDTGAIRCVTVCEAGLWLAVGTQTGFVHVLDIQTGIHVNTWRAHEYDVLQLEAYSDRFLITCGRDDSHMYLWDVYKCTTMPTVVLYKGHTDPINCFAVHQNELISVTSAARFGIHASLPTKGTFTMSRLLAENLSANFKSIQSLAVLPLNRQFLFGTEGGTITLMC